MSRSVRALAAVAVAAIAFTAPEAAAQRGARQPAPMSVEALRARLGAYTADSMRGRLTGTPDHKKAVDYIAAELGRMGLTPAGDNGTFLQRVPLATMALDTANATLTVAGRPLRPYVDYLPRNNGATPRRIDGAPVVYAGLWGTPSLLAGGAAVAGKTVVIGVTEANNSVVRLEAIRRYFPAAAIVIANFDLLDPGLVAQMSAAPMTLDAGEEEQGPEIPAYLHLSRASAAALFGATDLSGVQPGQMAAPIRGDFGYKRVPAETFNVVATLRGSDRALAGQYVAIGAHSDHVGVGEAVDRDSLRAFNLELRTKQLANGGAITPAIVQSIRVNMDSIRRVHPVARRDSIFNGADDDGSGSMGVLEVARAFATAGTKPKRSLIFVWHAGEELGLFGSEWFTDHPTVPRDSIVAQLNFDMIGRGGPGEEPGGGPNYAQLIGSRRLSTQLGDLVEQVSREKGYGWAFDYQYDVPGHPEQYYCRSDHYMYARYGIPIVFLSTGGHADYHQVTDEVEFIDFAKLSKVSRYAYDLATAVGNLSARPVVDKAKPDPRGQCVQ